MGTHFSFLFSIYFKNHGVQAEPLNFARSSDITYVLWDKTLVHLITSFDMNTINCNICQIFHTRGPQKMIFQSHDTENRKDWCSSTDFHCPNEQCISAIAQAKSNERCVALTNASN